MRAGALALMLALAAQAAAAQDAPLADDPIAAVLADPQAYADEDEAEAAPVVTAAEAPPAPPVARPPPAVIRPPAPAPRLERPVTIDEVGVSPEGPPRPQDVGYDMRIRAGVADAQSAQGPLDGGWTVSGPGGAGLYSLQLVDPGDPGKPLEGAWRNLQRQGVGTTGLISSLDQGPGKLVVRFNRRHADSPTVLTLERQADGGWAGEMWEDGRVQAVAMRR